MKKIAVLGSTGSIGCQTLEVIDSLGPEYSVAALTAGSNDRLLAEQVRYFKPDMAALNDTEAADRLRNNIKSGSCLIEAGPGSHLTAATWPSADLIVLAQVGFSGFKPLVAALQHGKKIALANKESLVIGGEILMRQGLLDRERILPVDSEHSAIWQCLGSSPTSDVNRIFLTASGGPFFGRTREELEKVTPAMALKHPNWQMGNKITIDSATMMNKGLEVIEARWLFGLSLEQIEVIIHRQSIIHSMVEYIDGSILAQMGPPNMKLPIQYALTYPERKKSDVERYDPFGRILEFDRPDRENFPCLELAFSAARTGGTMPAVLNGSNEAAVAAFIEGKITFTAIPLVIQTVMHDHAVIIEPGVEDVVDANSWSQVRAAEVIDELTGRVS